jgi:hypothetical protein
VLSKANYWEQCRKQRLADFEDLQVGAAVQQQCSQMRSALGSDAQPLQDAWLNQRLRQQVDPTCCSIATSLHTQHSKYFVT